MEKRIKLAAFILMSALGWIFIMGHCRAIAGQEEKGRPDFSRLLSYISRTDLKKPLVFVEDEREGFDRRLNRENLDYLNDNAGLLQQIKDKLHSDHIEWKLARASKRLLAVPEHRKEYASLFEKYCKAAVAFVLDRTKMPSPFSSIITLQGPLTKPEKALPADGTNAYLVHNLAEEYVEEYLFFDPEAKGAKIKIRLSNKVFTGVIGSYSSRLAIDRDRQFEFVREPYIFWQNSALNPLNVFIVPVEETLHGILRASTEDAIRSQLKEDDPQTMADVRAVVDHWIAVEESAVGGLVADLMPDVLDRFLSDSMSKRMAAALAERRAHKQYRYLDRGVRLVEDLGVDATITMYHKHIQDFAHLVSADERAEGPAIPQG